MKKQQRPFHLEEDGAGTSGAEDENFLDDLDGDRLVESLDDGPEEEEIIDLVEVVDDVDDEIGDLGEEEALLSADSDPDPSDFDERMGSKEGDEDLLKELGFIDEKISFGDDEYLEVRVVDEQVSDEAPTGRAEGSALSPESMMGLSRELDAWIVEDTSEPLPVEKLPEPPEIPAIDAVGAPFAEAAPAEAQPGKSEAPGHLPDEDTLHGEASLEDALARIELRLVEMVRQIVEARLPGIVRDVLREEIEQIKRESH